ncbi:MAG TPA: hypothetical protein EYP49_21105 [Anaerolineae bacterium]|nr:hypothetical protein [Anaerolineae bacterium]
MFSLRFCYGQVTTAERTPVSFSRRPISGARFVGPTVTWSAEKTPVSHFRHPLVKRLVPPGLLAAVDGSLQWTASLWKLSPSIFVRARAEKAYPPTEPRGFFRCPACHNPQLVEMDQALDCPNCNRKWPVDDGIYDFKCDQGV